MCVHDKVEYIQILTQGNVYQLPEGHRTTKHVQLRLFFLNCVWHVDVQCSTLLTWPHASTHVCNNTECVRYHYNHCSPLALLLSGVEDIVRQRPDLKDMRRPTDNLTALHLASVNSRYYVVRHLALSVSMYAYNSIQQYVHDKDQDTCEVGNTNQNPKAVTFQKKVAGIQTHVFNILDQVLSITELLRQLSWLSSNHSHTYKAKHLNLINKWIQT